MSPTPTVATADVKLDPIFERYKTRLINRGRKAQTIANFTRAVVPFQQWLDQQGIDFADVDEETLETYFAPANFEKLGYSPGTRRLHAVQVCAVVRYAFKRGKLSAERDPLDDFEKPEEPASKPREKLLTSAQLRQCYADCRNWRHETLFALLTHTGMRRDEIRLLSWENIDLDAGVIYVTEDTAKLAKPREVPIHPWLHEVLERAPARGQITNPELKEGPVLWTSAAGSADTRPGGHYAGGQSFEKLKRPFAADFGFHHFRKTAATSLRRNGVDPGVIDTIFGWSKRAVQDRYYVAVVDEDIHRAILKLYVDDPLGI